MIDACDELLGNYKDNDEVRCLGVAAHISNAKASQEKLAALVNKVKGWRLDDPGLDNAQVELATNVEAYSKVMSDLVGFHNALEDVDEAAMKEVGQGKRAARWVMTKIKNRVTATGTPAILAARIAESMSVNGVAPHMETPLRQSSWIVCRRNLGGCSLGALASTLTRRKRCGTPSSRRRPAC